MANRYAVASGSWSNTATWNGGTLPTSADDVYSNNFAVTVDQNISVVSLRNDAVSGVTAGGTFNFNTSGVIANISNTIVMNTTSTSFILVTATTGLVTMNMPNGIVSGTNAATGNLINYSGNCNLNITCIRFIGITFTANNTLDILTKSSTGILIFNGDLQGRNTQGSNNVLGYCLNLGGNSTNIINGNIIGGAGLGIAASAVFLQSGSLTVTGNVTGGTGISSFGILNNSIGTINITGNLIGGAAPAINSTTGTINITGIIIGGTGNGVVGASISGILNHVGVAQASLAGSAIFCGSPTTSVITCTGPFLRSGYTVAIASQTLRINAAYNPYFEFIKTPFVEVTYVNQSSLSFPATTNVRNGITYGSGVYTGTMIVPSPNYVRFGIPTDNTIGTAIITAADLFNEIAISPNPLAVRLRTVSTVGTVGQQLITYNNL